MGDTPTEPQNTPRVGDLTRKLDTETLRAYTESNRAAAIARELGGLAEEARANLGRFKGRTGRHRAPDNRGRHGGRRVGDGVGETALQNQQPTAEPAHFSPADIAEIGHIAREASAHGGPLETSNSNQQRFNLRSI